MEFNDVKIVSNGMSSTLILNGEDISSRVTGYRYEHKAGNRPVISIDYPVENGTINIELEKN